MPRCAIGVTWTQEERAKMRLPRLGEINQSLARLQCHEMTVDLEDGSSCLVTYRRFGARSHCFIFGQPLRESVWLHDALTNVAPTIEQKAAELAPKAFAQAMAEEQRQMRCRTMPKGSVVLPGEPQMKAKAAETVAGCYAVCVRHATGSLSVIGPASPTVEPVIASLEEGTFDAVQLVEGRRLVICICCRYLRRWIEPRLLPFPRNQATVCEVEDAELD